jgi:GTPase
MGKIRRVFISAFKANGVTELAIAIGEMLNKDLVEVDVVLLPKQARIRAELYSRNAVLAERIDEEGNYHLNVRLPQADLDKLLDNQKTSKKTN